MGPVYATTDTRLDRGLALVGCVEPEDDVGSSSRPIISGTVIAAEESGFVKLTTSAGRCSGTLLTNDWVITASHCFDPADYENPSSVVVAMGRGGRADPDNIGVFRNAAEIISHPQLDVTLVRTQSGFGMPDANNLLSRTKWERAIYNADTSTLSNVTVTCFGYGRNTYQSSSGQLRTAMLRVTNASGTSFRVVPNGSGQILWRGDSGGSCMLTTTDGKQVIAGVTSTCNYRGDVDEPDSIDYCTLVAGNRVNEWVSEVMMQRRIVGADNQCFDVPGGSRATQQTGPDHLWRLRLMSDGRYRIESQRYPTQCLQATTRSYWLSSATCSSTAKTEQRWRFKWQ